MHIRRIRGNVAHPVTYTAISSVCKCCNPYVRPTVRPSVPVRRPTGVLISLQGGTN